MSTTEDKALLLLQLDSALNAGAEGDGLLGDTVAALIVMNNPKLGLVQDLIAARITGLVSMLRTGEPVKVATQVAAPGLFGRLFGWLVR